MLKHDIRKIFLHKRKSLSKTVAKDFNQKIEHLFNDYLSKKIKTAHIYLPIHAKNEVDTWPIIHKLWSEDIRVVVPLVNENTLASKLLNTETKLILNKWDVPEPSKSIDINDKEIDMVIVPLLAFDTHGYRVGYGKGYYDRFLSSLPQKPIKVGLSYFPPVSNFIEKDSWDIPLDYCVTPEQVFKF